MRLPILVALGLTALAVVANSTAPSTMHYQGQLTDALDNPAADASYSMVFSIYDVAVGGTPLWTETQNVTTSGGLFNVLLGTINPLTSAYFNGAERYLGLTIGADPELSPRTRIASTPFALRTQTVDGASGGAVYGDLWVIHDDGSLSKMYSSGDGGAVNLYDQNSFFHSGMEPDMHGSSAGFLSIRNGVSGSALTIDGNVGGSLSPSLYMDGFGGVVNIDLSQSGDNAVIVPDNSVSATEMFNEPGIAASLLDDVVNLTPGPTMQDITTVTLTIPDAGYIVLSAQGWLALSGTTGVNMGIYQIDETAGGQSETPHTAYTGAFSFGDTLLSYHPLTTERVYFKPAGTYTFRLEANKHQFSTGNTALWWPKLTAVYYPTSYGAVQTSVSAGESAAFGSAIPVSMSTKPLPDGTAASAGSIVDLRELELKEARQRADLAETQRKLAEARLQEQRKDRPALEQRR